LLIYGHVGSKPTLSSVTATINAAAAADPNAPAMGAALETATALETLATSLCPRRIALTNVSLFPAGHPSSCALATPTPIAQNSRQQAQTPVHGKFLLFLNVRN
jgi:hypothetical protein